MQTNKEVLKMVMEAAEDRKAEDCLALDMTQLTPMADYYMICHGNSERQVQAIARAIKDAVEESGNEVKRMEGQEQARWILLDINNIICHVFHKEERGYYNLERLWGDAEIIRQGDLASL